MLANILGTIFWGGVLGALARLFMRGQQNMSLVWTIVCGIVGAAVGNVILSLFQYNNANGGISWWWWIICTICSIVAISIYLSFTGRK